jgi:hypothetical protein
VIHYDNKNQGFTRLSITKKLLNPQPYASYCIKKVRGTISEDVILFYEFNILPSMGKYKNKEIIKNRGLTRLGTRSGSKKL